jgi:hypothetical protein
VVCSNRGSCSSITGICTCDSSFGSSDAAGGPGVYNDCGFSIAANNCPNVGSGVCSNHGTCTGGPSYTCTCNSGYGGAACEKVLCPTGRAWFDQPYALDTAHATGAECSNAGLCNYATGVCTCYSLYTGTACQYLKCSNQCQGD